ncbi:MAG: hypothetical protein ACD_23C00663G0001, partial [uncultured bacterium]
MEHLAFHPGERKDGEVDHHDDELTEHQRPPRFLGSGKHFVESLVACQRPACGGLRV